MKGPNVCDVDLGNGFLHRTSKQRKKIDKLDFIKIKLVCPSKDIGR